MPRLLALFTIVHNPSEFPGKFVVRRFVVAGDLNHAMILADRRPLAVVDTLSGARHMLPTGLACLGCDPTDDPAIVEVWR